MDKPRIFADLRKSGLHPRNSGKRIVVLACRETVEDLNKFNVEFSEGMTLDFWAHGATAGTDGATEGDAAPLIFEGEIRLVRNSKSSNHNIWYAVVEINNIRPISVDPISLDKASALDEPAPLRPHPRLDKS